MRTMVITATLALALAGMNMPGEAGERNDRPRIHPSPGQTDVNLPRRSMDQDAVRNEWGEPRATHGPVGDPPITRWDYDRFTVYFEHDKVLHAFVPRTREDSRED